MCRKLTILIKSLKGIEPSSTSIKSSGPDFKSDSASLQPGCPSLKSSCPSLKSSCSSLKSDSTSFQPTTTSLKSTATWITNWFHQALYDIFYIPVNYNDGHWNKTYTELIFLFHKADNIALFSSAFWKRIQICTSYNFTFDFFHEFLVSERSKSFWLNETSWPSSSVVV